ncbi:MAG: hypothetical protein WCE21_04820 [Candidatus Babeliales bacterium]
MNYRIAVIAVRAIGCTVIVAIPFVLHRTSMQSTVVYCSVLDAATYATVTRIASEHRTASALCQAIEQAFPHLYLDYIKYTGNRRVCVIKEHPPLCRINNRTIVYANGACVTLNSAEPIPDTLWNITVHAPFGTRVSAALLAWWGTVPDEILNNYTIDWHSAQHIVLVSRACLQRHLYVTDRTSLDEQMLHCAHGAYDNLGVGEQHNTHIWITDLRFKGQIVIYKEGEWNEKRVIS